MSGEAEETAVSDTPESGEGTVDLQPKGRGRLRICKQCRFTCTDSKEFLHHQMKAHGEGDENQVISKLVRRNSAKSNTVKKRNSCSSSEHSMDNMMSEKTNGDESPSIEIGNEDEQEDEGRLIIAEENEPTPVTPTRCGNIQNRTYVCSVCDFTSTSAKTFLHHQKDEHKYDFSIYECDICEYATKYKQKLPRHRKLHFSGQDVMITASREGESVSLDTSFVEKDGEENGEGDEEEEEGEDDDEDVPVIADPNALEIVEKKKKTRQEVDPAKYFEVVDDAGIKYACSSCGNVYKWRKSLNKHWKEKHSGETPDGSKKPPGLVYLVNSGNHTIHGKRRIYSNNILSNIQQSNGKSSSIASHSPSLSRSDTPLSVNGPPSLTNMNDYSEPSPSQGIVIPNYIGPFVTNSCNPVYSSPSQPSASPDFKNSTSRTFSNVPNVSSQNEPLDFSMRQDDNGSLDPEFFKVKMEPLWDDDEEKNTDQNRKTRILQCTKCAFVAKTLVDYSSHMTLHLNKRAFKCAECQEHFNGVEDLNKHFADCHSEKIQEHKEAIQKIPHGLQQTYHLLKMPLDAITCLSSQDLTSTDSKQLNCNMCDFVAKWPAELQKHAVSHSEERPFMCMVCGSTYKWKWDLVKHFEKSHHCLPNPYKRREALVSTKTSSTCNNPNGLSHVETCMSKTAAALIDPPPLLPNWCKDGEPLSKRRRLSDSDMPDLEPRPMDRKTLDLHSVNLEIPRLIHADNSQHESGVTSGRPSSVPSRLDLMDVTSEEEDSLSRIQITNVQSIDDEMDFLLYKADANAEIRRPINEKTQKAIAAAVRNRISNQASKQQNETDINSNNLNSSCADILLPYKCPRCEYRARWPSEITQHMKNHSDEKPYHCPRCNYRSKWKWDVVKHLKRCGGGTIRDVIDTSKLKKIAPPNVMVLPEGQLQQQTPQPVAYLVTTSSSPSDLVGSPPAVLVPVLPKGNKTTSTVTTLPTPVQQKSFTPSAAHTAKPTPPKQTVFRSLINQGLYHCLECPFVGHSPAELKRHSVLHSENKPFTCRICGYSSRWKCDLKKHMKTYSHYSGSSSGHTDDMIGDEGSLADSDELDTKEKSFLKCNKCPYTTQSNYQLDAHMKNHGEPGQGNSPAKFKCKQCSFQVNDLSTFLQHRVTHSNQNAGQSSPAPSQLSESPVRMEDLNDPRLKHPRKPVKRLYCAKCDFICSKRETMDLHEAEHERESVFKCFYCDISVDNKDSLLDHITTHSEFNPDEWETFFMEDESAEENEEYGVTEPSKLDTAESANAVDLTVPSPPRLQPQASNPVQKVMSSQDFFAAIGLPHLNIPQPMSQRRNQISSKNVLQTNIGTVSQSKVVPRSIPQVSSKAAPHSTFKNVPQTSFRSIQPAPALASAYGATVKRFTCEWCEATFAHVTTLYQHAQNVHPLELRSQELNESSADQGLLCPVQTVVTVPVISQPITVTGSSGNEINFQSVAKKPVEIRPAKSSPYSGTTEVLMKAKKTTSPQKRARSFQCTKCPFTAPNAVTYLRHIERHGSNCKHTCWYCDYSIDRLNLLYQHMKGSHTEQWKGAMNLGDDPKTANPEHSIQKSPQAINTVTLDDTSSVNGEIYSETSTDSFEQMLKPVLILKEQTTWRGVPVQICSIDGKKNYKCPKCSYVSSNAANTSNHVRQHGSNRKYQCKHCDYSVDNLKLIYHHMETVHPKEPAFIEVNKNVEVAPAENENEENIMQELAINTEKPTQKMSPSGSSSMNSCPHCPFKMRSKDIFNRHLEMHSYNGKYRCEHCDYSVDRLNLLTQHVRVHEKFPGHEKVSVHEKTPVREKASLQGKYPLHEKPPPVDKIPSELPEMLPEKKIFTSLLNLKSVESGKPRLLTGVINREQTASGLASKLLTMQAKQVLQKSKMNGRVRYRCSRCPYNTFCKNNIIKHRKQHIIKSRYKCPFCNYSATRAYLLHQHIKFHENESLLKKQDKLKDFQDIVLDPLDPNSKPPESPQNEDGPDEAEPEIYEEMEMDDDEVTDVEEEKFELSDNPEVNEDDSESDLKQDDSSVADDSSSMNGKQFRNYKCTGCPFSSNSAFEFRKHSKLHVAGNRYKCDYCSYSLDRLNLLTQHRRLHSDEQNFDPCPSPTKLLNKDIINLDKSSTDMSDLGDRVSSSSVPDNQGTPPVSNMPVDEIGDQMRYTCEFCPYRCKTIKSYNVHVHMHGLKKKYICDHCNWSVDRLNLLYQHRKVHTKESNFLHSPEEIIFLNRKYALEAPGKFEAQVVKFEKQPSTPSKVSPTLSLGKKIYSCKHCPFSTNNKNSFAYHKMLHRMRARYTCPECSYSVDRWNLLNQHMRLHQEDKDMQQNSPGRKQRMKCPKCPYHSPSRQLLDVHISMHASGKKYTCSHCDYSIDRLNLLQQHLKVHEDQGRNSESPPLGDHQLKVFEPGSPNIISPQLYFSSPDDANMSDDSEETELKCERCPYSTPSKEELENHEVQHNVRDRLPCLYCDFSCSGEEKLLEHIQVHFPGSRVDLDVVKQMIAKYHSEKQDDSEGSFPVPAVKESKPEESTPDSTVEEQKTIKSESDAASESQDSPGQIGSGTVEDSIPKCTKVYVCQYCEREFENKVLMLQHERQHLIGHQY